MNVKLIAGVASNGVIGSEGSLPWHYPEDLKHFKETTEGCPVIMGRVTYEDIVTNNGSPLPSRDSIVLTSKQTVMFDDMDTVHVVSSIDEAHDLAFDLADSSVFVAGGESVYRQFMEYADELVLTEIEQEFDGDAHFPDIGDEWDVVKRIEKEGFDICWYK